MDILRQLAAGPISRDDLVIKTPDVGDVPVGPWVTAVPFETTTSTTATITLNVAEQKRRALIDAFEAFFQPDAQNVERVKKWNTIKVHGSTYVLREFSRTPGTFGLVFYDEASELLKRLHQARKISRNQATQAEFVAARCKEAGVPVFSPGKDDRQPIADLAPADIKALHKAAATNDQALQLTQRDASQAGLAVLRKAAKAGAITIKGAKPRPDQLRVMAEVLTAADSVNAVGKARLAVVMSCIVESSFQNGAAVRHKDLDSRGVLQLRDSTAASLKRFHHINIDPENIHDVVVGYLQYGFAKNFPDGAMRLAKKFPNYSAQQIASLTNQGFFASAYISALTTWRSEAEAILTVWSPGTSGSISDTRAGSSDRAYVQRYEYTTSRQEDYWEAFARLGSIVNWRRYAVFNTLVYANDIRLSLLTPYDFSETDDWIDEEPTWTCTAAQKLDEIQINGRLASLVPAGASFACHDTGPTYGTWIARSFARTDLLDETCPATMTLGRPQAPLAEPASTVITVPGTAPSSDAVGAIKPAPGRTYKLNTTRPDGKRVPPQKYLVEFLQALAGAIGHTVYVNTYSNHNQESSTGTGQSEHWTGNAADLYIGAGVDTKLGEQLCFYAIQLCGESLPHANKNAVEVVANKAAHQGTKSIGDGWEHFPWKHTETRNGVSAEITFSVQVIWKAPDGSHHDHVHIGIHPKNSVELLYSF